MRLKQELSKDTNGKNIEAAIGEEVDENLAEVEDGDADDSNKEAIRLKAMKIHHVICSAILPQLQKSMLKKVITWFVMSDATEHLITSSAQ